MKAVFSVAANLEEQTVFYMTSEVQPFVSHRTFGPGVEFKVVSGQWVTLAGAGETAEVMEASIENMQTPFTMEDEAEYGIHTSSTLGQMSSFYVTATSVEGLTVDQRALIAVVTTYPPVGGHAFIVVLRDNLCFQDVL